MEMEWEGPIELVRTLTREVIATLKPDRLATFAEDFAVWAHTLGQPKAEEKEPLPISRPPGNALETTLVAGMFFQVLREASELPAGTREQVSFISRQAKNYLATRLAGQIPLSQFFRLLNLIEEQVYNYFSESRKAWLTQRGPSRVTAPAPEPEEHEVINLPALRQALAALPLLPRGRRKLNPEALVKFFLQTGRDWFRLLDFEEHFGINKKTAWAYLAQLLKAGILEHNGERANRVRYTLARHFRR